MKLKLFFILTLLVLFSLQSHAGLFDNLFGGNKEAPKITQEEAIIIEDEEIISAEDYLNSIDEPRNIEVFSNDEVFSQAFDDAEEFIDDSDFEEPLVRAQSIFLSFLNAPKKIYLSQRVVIKIKAVVTNKNVTFLKTTFLKAKDVQILNKSTSWKKTSQNSYEISYIIKFFSTAGKLPDFKVTTYADGRVMSNETISSYEPKIIALREDKEFSLVLSKDFTLQSHNEKKYDEKSNIVVLELNASEANLEDFHIPYAIKDGIYDIKQYGVNQSIYYFAIIPNDIKIFKFKYFDLVSNKYHIVTFPILLQDSSISTQTDLNPQKSRFALYKAIALIVLAFVIFLFYMKTRALYLLVLTFSVLAFVLYKQIPISKVTLDKGVNLRILPTENSTIFYVTQEKIEADMLLKKDGYIKLLLPNKKIGWINEDSTKN